MRNFIITLTFLCSTPGIADEIRWDQKSPFKIDLDCDGIQDEITIGYINQDFIVKAQISTQKQPFQLQFGLSQPSRQDAICGPIPELSAYKSSEIYLLETLGSIPDGYKSDTGCFDLTVSGGECDPINIFWNHKAKSLDWWRL